jgi:hypothetical protein
MVIGGSSTVFWDLFASKKIGKMRAKWRRRKMNPDRMAEESNAQPSIPINQIPSTSGLQRRGVSKDTHNSVESPTAPASDNHSDTRSPAETQARNVDTDSHSLPVKWGLCIIAGFFGILLLAPIRNVIHQLRRLTLEQHPLSPSSLAARYCILRRWSWTCLQTCTLQVR